MRPFGLVNAMVAELTAPTLVGLRVRPADEALWAAHMVVRNAYTDAMESFGLWSWMVEEIERLVSREVEATIAEYIRLRHSAPR